MNIIYYHSIHEQPDDVLLHLTIFSEPYEAAPELYYSGWGCSGSPLSGEEDAPSLTSRSATASHTDPPAHMHMLPTDARTGKIMNQI